MSRPDDCCLSPSQLATVKKHAALLLNEASALHVFPTPIERIMAAAKLTVVEDELADAGILRQFMQRAKATIHNVKSAIGKILAMIHVSERFVVIDKCTPKPRLPFIKLHEAGHGTLPHQSKTYSLIQDSEQSLDPEITELFEREANVFASEVLFQGALFEEEARQSAFGMKVPIALAKKYGASNYSAFRRYVSTNPHPCCVIVLNQPVLGIGKQFNAEVRRIITTRTFDDIFDGERFGASISEAHILSHMVPLGGRRMTAERRIKLTDRHGQSRDCTAEAFNTTHQIFILLKDEGPSPTVIAAVGVWTPERLHKLVRAMNNKMEF